MPMQYGNIPGIDKPVSRLVQGTLMVDAPDGELGFDLLDSILAMGCNTFDTARVYGGGTNEGVVGKWVNERGIRDEVIIIGKGAHPNKVSSRRVTPDDITADLTKSLSEFQFDTIDIYLLHRDDETQPVGPIIEVLNEHQAAGRIRIFGGSNWTHHRLEAANEYADKHGLNPFTASSPNFSMAEQVQAPWPGCISISGPANAEARAWYAEQNMPLLPWSSLAGGFFSGRFTPDNLDSMTDGFDLAAVKAYCYPDNFKRLERAKKLAEETNLTVPQVATAYVMSYPLNTFALVGCHTPDQFRDNMAAMDIHLDNDTLEWLDLREESR